MLSTDWNKNASGKRGIEQKLVKGKKINHVETTKYNIKVTKEMKT